MRAMLGLCVLLVTVYSVASELCTVPEDCTGTSCNVGELHCSHPADTIGIEKCNGRCTCGDGTAPVQDQCTFNDDCVALITCKRNQHFCRIGTSATEPNICICLRHAGRRNTPRINPCEPL